MTKELNIIIKTVFDCIDQISENISDLRDRQEKIKIVLLSMFGTIIGMCAYNNYMSASERENHVIEESEKNNDNGSGIDRLPKTKHVKNPRDGSDK